MDILAALTNEAPNNDAARPCPVARWVETIDETTPGRDDLVATLTTTDPRSDNYRPLPVLARLLRTLGLVASEDTIGRHRTGRCRCNG